MKSFDEEQIAHRRLRRPTESPATRERQGDGFDVRGGPGRPVGPGHVLALQRTAGNAAVAQLLADNEQDLDESESPVRDVVGKGGGEPLEDSVRTDMEVRFGQDFSDVRIHRDAEAAASARSVQASAYTVGDDIVFGSSAPDLGSAEGEHTLAHELAHVVQQRSGPVDGTPVGGGIRISDPSDKFETEAERVADEVQAGGLEAGGRTGTVGVESAGVESAGVESAGAGAFAVQREDEEVDEEMEAGEAEMEEGEADMAEGEAEMEEEEGEGE